jgi:hypothetical protein
MNSFPAISPDPVPGVSQSEVHRVRSALTRLSGTEQSGAQLRAAIDLACPELDLRSAATFLPGTGGALTKFLKAYLSDIVRPIGKRGGDTLFSVGVDASPPRYTFWQAFSSPALGLEIIFDRQSNDFTIRPKGTPASTTEICIEPVLPDEFRRIAEDFALKLDEPMKSDLRSRVADNPFYYNTWTAELKQYPDLYRTWGLFRVQAIKDLFRRRLDTAQVPEEKIQHAMQLLAAAQEFAYKERIRSSRSNPETWDQSPPSRAAVQLSHFPTDDNDTSAARAVATLLIRNMSLTDIRELRVPLGAILDAALLHKT